jgi:transcriptional regulator with GAF, ATPase, and Fis domain/tetratricopeptide (TPR) repeat protein
MANDRSSEDAFLAASLLMKRGRFAEALSSLQVETRVSQIGAHPGRSLLADVLQRTGRNLDAEQVASRYLRITSAPPSAIARCHFVMGSICRERGDINGAISHLQTASHLVTSDLELSCWIQLRLMAAVAELAGGPTAIARLGEVKRCLTRCGDPRPFAALHLWIAEIETTCGSLDSARRHLRIAHSLLAQIDDVWLHGYFAINSFGVSYYSAEIREAKRWADVAMECAALSGHAAGRRAAHANLGHIEFSMGRLSRAEECFRLALEYSEKGSRSHFAILDSIAQIKLSRGEFRDCQTIVDQLDGLSTRHSKGSHYPTWALQTKIQLLLKEGRLADANGLCDSLGPLLGTIAHPRLRAILGLLSAEVSIANRNFEIAAEKLGAVLSSSVELPPDLLAETERLIARTLRASEFPDLGRISLERAVETFEVIGHTIGRDSALSDASSLQSSTTRSVETFSARTVIDRVRVLLETMRRPELFTLEAFRLLRDLNCSEYAALSAQDGSEESRMIHKVGRPSNINVNSEAIPRQEVTLDIGSPEQRKFRLTYLPRCDAASILSARSFQRIVEKILRPSADLSEVSESEILWPANEWLSNDEVVFAADSMMDILRTINKIATTNISVLITGETGTGKEVIAKTLHERSDRAKKPFVALNCAAVPRELLESQLFGFRRGAFSGAHEQFSGVVRAAIDGTLLLDEIGELPIEVQPKLLRFIESGEIHPLGESRPIRADVRLIFATNAGIEELVRERRFREDLFFRINVIHIKVPPLRERPEEIPLLINLFAQRFSRELSKETPKFSSETIEQFILYRWPGNVRQLSNEVRRLIATTDGGKTITPDVLSTDIRRASDSAAPKSADAFGLRVKLEQTLSSAVHQVEGSMIEHALNKANGRVAVAAEMLGLSRKGLYLKRQRLGILELRNKSDRFVQDRR